MSSAEHDTQIQEVAAFDLSAAPSVADIEDQGVTFHVRDYKDDPMYYRPHEGAEPKPVTMTVAGTYSNIFRRAEEAFERRKWKGTISPEVYAKAREEYILPRCILRWEGFVDGGRAAELTLENALKAVRTPWLVRQIRAHMEDHESFFEQHSRS